MLFFKMKNSKKICNISNKKERNTDKNKLSMEYKNQILTLKSIIKMLFNF